MKRTIGVFLLMWLALSLTACAAGKGEVRRITCPACEYEFDLPAK